jgi:hypothetical protein
MRQGKGSAFQMPRLGLERDEEKWYSVFLNNHATPGNPTGEDVCGKHRHASGKGKRRAGMKRAGVLVVVLGLGLAGCGFGQSKFNPLNWWAKARTGEPVALYTAPVDPRGLVAAITLLKVEPYPGGAIVRATGVPPTQGYWDAALVALPNDGSGKLVFEFRIYPPVTTARAGTQPSREVVVATNLTDYKLQDITSIEVRSASNAMTAHR